MTRKHSTVQARTLLWKSLENGNIDQLNKALALGGDPDSAHGRWIPLGKALRRNHLDLAKALLEAGANPLLTDQGVSLISIAAGNPNLAPVVLLMLEKGVQPTPEILRTAAYGGNLVVVRALLGMGMDPSPRGEKTWRHETPALACWPTNKYPPPIELIEATFKQNPGDEAVIEIITCCVRARNEPLLHLLITQPHVSARCLNILLHRCIGAHWERAIDTLLSNRICDPQQVGEEDDPILGAVTNCLRHGKNKNQSWVLLDRLMDYGYHPSATYRQFCIGHGEPHYRVSAPVWLEAIRTGPQAGRKRLIKKFIENGARLDDRYSKNGTIHQGGGLVHMLVSIGDFETAQWSWHAWPKQIWEGEGLPGVIATWACVSEENKMKQQLQALLEMGFDISRCDLKGKTALRRLLARTDINAMILPKFRISHDTLHELACILLSYGKDIKQVSEDFDFARTIGIASSKVSEWEALVIRNNVQHPTHSVAGRRPRL